jgi:uncharacterized protein with FMN-binding domain
MRLETSVSKDQPTRAFDLVRTVRKFFVSAFVVLTFVAYAFHKRFVNPDEGISAATPTQSAASTQPAPASLQVRPTPQVRPTTSLLALATPRTAPTPTAKPKGPYKDGAYTGGEVDAFYGLVQVEAVIQDGKIADVQFLEYPNDRRTSVRINSIAMPYLTTEAIQAQNANVDIISGATLTSEAFIMSLQAALRAAKA